MFSISDFYDCNEPLFDRATVTATSWLPERDPKSAKLDGIRRLFLIISSFAS